MTKTSDTFKLGGICGKASAIPGDVDPATRGQLSDKNPSEYCMIFIFATYQNFDLDADV